LGIVERVVTMTNLPIAHIERVIDALEADMVSECGNALGRSSVAIFAYRLKERLHLGEDCPDGQCLDAGQCRIQGRCTQDIRRG
jgi:hypothetical protein